MTITTCIFLALRDDQEGDLLLQDNGTSKLYLIDGVCISVFSPPERRIYVSKREDTYVIEMGGREYVYPETMTTLVVRESTDRQVYLMKRSNATLSLGSIRQIVTEDD